MKRISVVVCLLAATCVSLVLAGCGKDNRVTTGSERKGASPKLTFEKNVYDFGEVGVNTTRTDQIEFSNTGEALLKITHIEGCCGVSVKLDKTALEPGETGILEMEWTAKPVPTTMMWRIVVQSNDRANPEVTLTMMAKLFKNHHRMQVQLAKRIYAIIMAHMPDTQIQRILGGSDRYVFDGDEIIDTKNNLRAPIRNMRDLNYNIDIEESPTNMTKSMAQLAVFIEMMSKGFPVDPKAVVSRLDLPESDKQEWTAYIEQTQKSNMEDRQYQKQLQQAMTQMQQQRDAMQAQKNAGELGLKQERLQLDAAKMAGDQSIKVKELQQEEMDDRYDFTVELMKLGLQERQLVMDLINRLASIPLQLPATTQPGKVA